MVQDHREKRGAAAEGAPTAGAASAPKRLKCKMGSNKVVKFLPQQAEVDEVAHLMTSGMFGDVTDGPVLLATETWRELCTEEFETFMAKGMEESLTTRSVSLMLEYWGSGGEHF